MPIFLCEQCGSELHRRRNNGRPIRFCFIGCYHRWQSINPMNAGSFVKGLTPWNKGIPVSLSPATQFKPGHTATRKDPVGATRIRTSRRDGRQRAYVKIAEPNIWKLRAVHVWESIAGPLPEGLLVHHKDRDCLYDNIENLEAMTRAEHINEHRAEYNRSRAERFNNRRRMSA